MLRRRSRFVLSCHSVSLNLPAKDLGRLPVTTEILRGAHQNMCAMLPGYNLIKRGRLVGGVRQERVMALTRTNHLSEQEYRQFALSDSQGQWELHEGQLRQRPGMSVEHGDIMVILVTMLANQLDRGEYRIRAQHARLRVSADTHYIPDVAVIPTPLEQALRPGSLDAYIDPLPLVIEVWSPSTGDYDAHAKLPEYQRRGDREIWYIHPYEHTLTACRRQADGSYSETLFRGGIVPIASLPGVTIDLDALLIG